MLSSNVFPKLNVFKMYSQHSSQFHIDTWFYFFLFSCSSFSSFLYNQYESLIVKTILFRLKMMNPVKHRFRYIVVFLGLACLTSILSNYIIINFTFICMKDDPTGIETTENGVGEIFKLLFIYEN